MGAFRVLKNGLYWSANPRSTFTGNPSESIMLQSPGQTGYSHGKKKEGNDGTTD